MENPFVYGQVVRGEHFADRKSEIQELIIDLSRGQNVIIFSPRRFGKTSLILEVLDRLKEQGLDVLYIDLYRVTSKEKFINTLAKAISKSYSGKIETVLSELKRVLPRLIPKVVIKGDEMLEFEFEYDNRGDVAPLVEDLLDVINDRAEKRGKRAVVVFDEFQELTAWDDGEIEREMRAHFQMHQHVAYVFMGSKRHLMMDIFRNKNRPFYRFGKHFPLGKIPKEEFAQFISLKFQEGKFNISDSAIFKILDKTESHPYYTQLLCSVLWDRFSHLRSITESDIEEGVEAVITRESHAYNNIWDALTLKSKQLLEALAVAPRSQIYSNDFLKRHGLGSPSSVQRAVKSLEQAEIIERENDTYMFTDVFFKLWIEKRLT